MRSMREAEKRIMLFEESSLGTGTGVGAAAAVVAAAAGAAVAGSGGVATTGRLPAPPVARTYAAATHPIPLGAVGTSATHQAPSSLTPISSPSVPCGATPRIG